MILIRCLNTFFSLYRCLSSFRLLFATLEFLFSLFFGHICTLITALDVSVFALRMFSNCSSLPLLTLLAHHTHPQTLPPRDSLPFRFRLFDILCSVLHYPCTSLRLVFRSPLNF